MHELHDFPSDILERHPELVRQHDILRQVQLWHQGELLRTGIPARYFQSLETDARWAIGAEPAIKVTYSRDMENQQENFYITLYRPGTWERGSIGVSDLVAIRRDAADPVVPAAEYDDLEYNKLVTMTDGLRELIANGTLPDVDEGVFEIRQW